MIKDEMRTKLYWRSQRGEVDPDGAVMRGLLERSDDLQATLALVLKAADNMAQQLVGIDFVQNAVAATRLQGNLLGLRAAVDVVLNAAYDAKERNDEAA